MVVSSVKSVLAFMATAIELRHSDEKTNHRGHRGHGEIRGKREFFRKYRDATSYELLA
ncbi:MAG: hypothetical protein Fur006_61610 [Coleofasciculaceae cyanobacterium]